MIRYMKIFFPKIIIFSVKSNTKLYIFYVRFSNQVVKYYILLYNIGNENWMK